MSSIGNHQEGDIEFTNDSTVKWLLMPLESHGLLHLVGQISKDYVSSVVNTSHGLGGDRS